MRIPQYHASVYGIIRNNKGEILVAQRGPKANGFQGRYQLPAGHMELGETVFEALQREMKEELTIYIKEENVELKHTVHRVFQDEREYFDFYFEISDYEGEIQIGEPDKCSDIQYVSFEELEDLKLLKHDYIALENIERGISFAELYLKNGEY